MPRTTKCRRVCGEPANKSFLSANRKAGHIILSVEELEAIRFCDGENVRQDVAALQMNVSRGTLQRILYQAHQKLAEALCEGKSIFIEGGHYQLSSCHCGCSNRCKKCSYYK